MKAVFRLFYYISILLTILLAIFTLLGGFARWISPESSLLASLAGLIMPVLLVLNLLVTIYWTVRWRYWVFIPLVAIAWNWEYISNIYQIPHQVPSYKGDNILTVGSYNVCSFNFDGPENIKANAISIAQYMQSQKVDILCLQECTLTKEQPLDSIKAIFSYWPYSYVPQSPEGKSLLQLAVFSKYPIGKKELRSFARTSNCSMWLDVDINGQTLRIFNHPRQICFDKKGNLYVADGSNHVIRKVSPDGIVSTVVGIAGVKGYRDGSPDEAMFNQPDGVAIDDEGTIYIADYENRLIRKLSIE